MPDSQSHSGALTDEDLGSRLEDLGVPDREIARILGEAEAVLPALTTEPTP